MPILQRLSNLQIAIRVCPKRLRWFERGATTAWTKAHECVDALQDLVRDVDVNCIEVEQNPDLSVSAIARRRAEICDQTLSKLVDFLPFEIAEKAVTENIDALERLSELDAQQVQMHKNLTKALADLREGVEATKRLVRERCKMRESTFV